MDLMAECMQWILVRISKMILTVTARVFPPVTPSSFKNKRRLSYLINLFRPEFLLRFSTSLNPDAYSPFCKDGKDDIDHATATLKEEIQNTAQQLDSVASKLGQIDMLVYFHAHGFNYRYLGLFYSNVKSQVLKKLVLTEMVTRVLKDNLKKELRSVLQKDLAGRKQTAVKFFNQVFDPMNFSKDLWEISIKQNIQQKFDDPLSDAEMAGEFDLRENVNLQITLQDLQQLVGVQVISSDETFPLKEDQIEMVVIVKHRAYACANYAEKLQEVPQINFERGWFGNIKRIVSTMQQVALGNQKLYGNSPLEDFVGKKNVYLMPRRTVG